MALTWDQLAERILRLPPEVRQQNAVIVDIYGDDGDEYFPVLLGVDEEGGEDGEPMQRHAFLHRVCDNVEAYDAFPLPDPFAKPDGT
jgi:hypothetical protein